MTETKSDVFNRIAPSWYNFRHHTIFRRELTELADNWQKGKLLNLGCGHGADFLPFKNNFNLFGVDISPVMIEYARKYASKYSFEVDLSVANMTYLPYKDCSFDFVIAVASIHHLDSIEARHSALSELHRVLKPGGQTFITVWNRHQPRFWFKKKDITVPWRQRNDTLYRYYHLFSYGEITRLLKYAGFSVLKIFPEYSYRLPCKLFSRNICILVERETDKTI